MDFVRGRGYVLEFSDSSFSEFFASELDVDIDDPAYAAEGSSKGKRLRCFLHKVDNETAVRALKLLWEHRGEIIARSRRPDPVQDAEGRFLTLIARLGDPSANGKGDKPIPVTDRGLINALRRELLHIREKEPQARGYAFETFLIKVFEMSGLTPRQPFRNVGEQIDGSFVLGNETYLLEAKWQTTPTGAADLHVLQGKLDQKAVWARGLFVSYSGFSADGLTAFGPGKRLVCMEGKDIYDALDHHIPIKEVIERKVRFAAETGQAFVPLARTFATRG